MPFVKDESNEHLSGYHSQQQHGGLIIRKKEPYMSILRSRPRQIGRVQESIQILLGSKVEKIDAAIRQARLCNNFIKSQNIPNLHLTVEDSKNQALRNLSRADIEVKLTLLKSYIQETTAEVTKAYDKMKEKLKREDKAKKKDEKPSRSKAREDKIDGTVPVKKSILKKSTKYQMLDQP